MAEAGSRFRLRWAALLPPKALKSVMGKCEGQQSRRGAGGGLLKSKSKSIQSGGDRQAARVPLSGCCRPAR